MGEGEGLSAAGDDWAAGAGDVPGCVGDKLPEEFPCETGGCPAAGVREPPGGGALADGLADSAGDDAEPGGVAIGPAGAGFFCASSATVSSMARSIGMRAMPLLLSTHA